MDAQSLAMEMAPIITWQKGWRPEHFKQFWDHSSKLESKENIGAASNYSQWDMLAECGETQDASSSIPLDDGMPVYFHAIEVIQCLIKHHNAVFTDDKKTIWR